METIGLLYRDIMFKAYLGTQSNIYDEIFLRK